ncbi:hypothetical protein LINPERPRIM_LOCUS37628 [Linum perenne]
MERSRMRTRRQYQLPFNELRMMDVLQIGAQTTLWLKQ